MNQLGLLCGTFNPIHWGHLMLAECARNQFQLDKVLFVTSGCPPHRHTDLLEKESRHYMVEAAVSSNEYFEPCRLELDRPGASYTVDTLRHFQSLYGKQTRLNLIIGADNLPYIKQWHQASEIFQLCRLLVAPRPNSPLDPSQYPGIDFLPLDIPQTSISSTLIRERLRQGQSVLYMVPPEVNRLLLQNHHYQKTTSSGSKST